MEPVFMQGDPILIGSKNLSLFRSIHYPYPQLHISFLPRLITDFVALFTNTIHLHYISYITHLLIHSIFKSSIIKMITPPHCIFVGICLQMFKYILFPLYVMPISSQSQATPSRPQRIHNPVSNSSMVSPSPDGL